MPDLKAITARIDGYDPDALALEQAKGVIEAALEPILESESVALLEALGRITAHDVISPIDVPAHDNSAMDGYALRAADLVPDQPVSLTEVGVALAGAPFRGQLEPGTCVRIMTGAVMPGGADTVVPQELVSLQNQRVLVPARQKSGQHRRLRGEDLAAGKTAIDQGTRLMPAELGLLASLGLAQVQVRRRLRVAIISTGDEIRSLGEPLEPGSVYDSNRYTLFGMLSRLNAEVIDLGVVRDDPHLLEKVLREATRLADAVITSGGVSVGEADHTRALMARLGEVAFWKIAIKPGRPMAFGHLHDGKSHAVLFGLPGNPVAVMVTFYALVRDALEKLAGARIRPMPMITAVSDSALRKKPGRTEYQRGVAHLMGDGWHVRMTGAQGSGILRSMSEANCLIVLPHDSASVEVGDRVSALPFDGLV
ncbi:MAG: gephyrin-like molybdotransferase Glp [Burkholderiaceae bacterium]|jgi:molybdopterin molybdotransferase